LLAPQSGRIATDKVKTNNCEPLIRTRASCVKRNILPELSNFCCLPGRAGGSPYGLGATTLAVAKTSKSRISPELRQQN
jgi:hypothetical protein